ncbi:MAG: RidA family protein [Dehalococcoidia bacterium]
MEIERKLQQMGITLPEVEPPIANYLPYVRSGNLLFLAGHIGDLTDALGQLGKDVTVEQGYEAARKTAIVCLSTVKSAIGDLDKVKRFVKLLCMVNSAAGFSDQPKVANGCSDLLVEIFGERGRHARSAVGMAGLPGNGCVEIEMIVEVED